MSYLVHHGIKGQKWGVRRFQNPDGTLTPAGRARLTKEYRKAYKRLNDDMNNKSTNLYVDSYNRMAERMNNGLTDKYNSDFDNAHKDRISKKNYRYDDDDEYTGGYEKLTEKVFNEEAAKVWAEFIKNHAEYQHARSLVESYGEDALDDLSRKDYHDIEDMLRRGGL